MPRPAKKECFVRSRGVVVRIAQLRDGRWQINHQADGRRRRWTFRELADAKSKAREMCDLYSAGRIDLAMLTPSQVEQVRAFLSSQGVSQTVGEACEAMLDAKRAASGRESRGLRGLRDVLRVAIRGLERRPIGQVSVADLERQVAAHRHQSDRYRKNIRSALVTLWRWARSRGILPDATTAAERMEPVRVVPAAPAVYTRPEFDALLQAARPEHRAWIALQGWAGVRREEIDPGRGSAKPRMTWGAVQFDRRLIDVPAACAKNRIRRIIPMQDVLARTLEPMRGAPDAPIAASTSEEIRRLGPAWRRNALRDSYITYRVAQTQDMPRVALEAGNSVTMIQRHYWAVASEAEGAAWFATRTESSD